MKRARLGLSVLSGILGLTLGTIVASGSALPAVDFNSNGDFISGWYWLRDLALEQQAWWTFEGIPQGTDDVVLEITCLATDQPNGKAGVPATFRIGFGFPGVEMMGGVFSVQDVELSNVSSPEDSVGYTCQGTLTIPHSTPGLASGTVTVFAERTSAFDPHVAFNKDSILICTAPASSQSPSELRIASTSEFSSNGTAIEGSTWCRGEGQYLEWLWHPVQVGGAVEEAGVNLNLLVTNTYSGGSSYSVRVIVQLLTRDGDNVYSGFADLVNPFLPEFPGDSHGAGYAAHGAMALPMEVVERYGLLSAGFGIRIEWPPMRSDYHFAGGEASAVLAWIEAPTSH